MKPVVKHRNKIRFFSLLREEIPQEIALDGHHLIELHVWQNRAET